MDEKYCKMKQFYSVLTNGETGIKIRCGRYDCMVNPDNHIFGQDGNGNMYIDGKLAHVGIRQSD